MRAQGKVEPLTCTFAQLHTKVPLAQALLTMMVCLVTATSCVLPPPPTEVPEVTQPLFVDAQKVAPAATGPHLIQRLPGGDLGFDLKDSVENPDPQRSVHTYWFVDFDFAKPQVWKAQDVSAYKVCGCDPDYGSGGVRTVIVEALVTYGTLNIILNTEPEEDPRRTQNGEAIHKVSWIVQVDGTATGCDDYPCEQL